MIVIEDLTICYENTTAVDHMNIQIGNGDKVAIVGRSGCGKTTLLLAIAGLIPSTSGRILISDKGIQDVQEGTAIILQEGGLFPWKKVSDNIRMGLIGRGLSRCEEDRIVEESLMTLGLDGVGKRYLKELSGGQRQRVAIARALVQSPNLLLMDEPAASLDMVSREQFQEVVLNLYQGYPVTSVLVTHDIEEAVYLGEKIIIMEQGMVAEMMVNECYGKEDARDSIDFYEMCLKVRKVMAN